MLQDIEDFVSGEMPVVFLSLGSITKGTTMPLHYQQILIDAFAKLPYKLLWKFEMDRKDFPPNVMIKQWMPQQDVLG